MCEWEVTMNFINKKLIFCVLMLFSVILYASEKSYAAEFYKVVYDENGGIVRDNFGGCVRTMWPADNDVCGGPVVSSDVVTKIMGMKERIIYFDFDKSNLKSDEMGKLDALVQVFKEHNVKSAKIVGYTDRIGAHEYNMKLSSKRADTVKHYLNSKINLEKTPVEMRALGEKDQVKECKGIKGDALIKCLAPNRRVEVEVDYYDIVR
jgi:OOP family OmpA-OmpF porin